MSTIQSIKDIDTRKPLPNIASVYRQLDGCAREHEDHMRCMRDGTDAQASSSYTFRASSTDAIDYEEILSELSRQSPVAVVDIKEDGEDEHEYKIFLHKSLADKTGMTRQIYHFESQKQAGEYLATLKAIVNSEWDGPSCTARVSVLDRSMSHKWA